MPRPNRRRLDFDPERIYEYPTHLRQALDALPAAPGVYIFHGQEGDLPLYIGKSVNLRSRVLSHLRTVEEARMLRQTQRISHIQTTGEIGALLLESQLIKERYPLYNQKLRRSRQLCALRVLDSVPEVVYAKDIDFASTPHLYGLFASRHAALDSLRTLADAHKLCYGALGLEKRPQGRACFRAMLKQCNGVCRGDESADQHRARMLTALQALSLVTWPFAGAIGLQETFEGQTQIHVVRNWCYLGSVSTVDQGRSLAKVAANFDADSYKILCKPLLNGTVPRIALD